jgi:hypothetical protein
MMILHTVADEAGQGPSGRLNAVPLRIGGGAAAIDPLRTALTFGKQQRFGTTGVEAGKKVVSRHEGSASVGNEKNQ